MKFLIILFLTLLPVQAFAHDWNKTDVALEVVSAGITIVDWGQTLNISDHGGMYEMNPILGKHPERREINTYFISVLTIHPIVSMLLPPKARTIWQSIYIGVELTAIGSNYKSGLRMDF